jgi:AraC-like DNA-binding protein
MDEHSLPGTYVLYSVELVKRWGITAEELLSGTGLAPETLADPRVRVPISACVAILERGRELTGEPYYGIFLGLQMRVSAHGQLGAAALAASTMREAIQLSIQFLPIMTTALSLRLRVEGRDASLIVEEHADFGPARDSVLLAALVGMGQIGQSLAGHELPGFVDLALPKPHYAERLQLLNSHVRFEQPVHRLFFEASMLDTPYKMADPVALLAARDQCERILAALAQTPRVTARVRALMSRDKGQTPSLRTVASAMHVSPRTLKRQLAAEGTSFSQIEDEERREKAMFLLGSPNLSLKEIAGRLGYANLANFSRAFQRWTGHTPGEHRSLASRKSS